MDGMGCMIIYDPSLSWISLSMIVGEKNLLNLFILDGDESQWEKVNSHQKKTNESYI